MSIRIGGITGVLGGSMVDWGVYGLLEGAVGWSTHLHFNYRARTANGNTARTRS